MLPPWYYLFCSPAHFFLLLHFFSLPSPPVATPPPFPAPPPKKKAITVAVVLDEPSHMHRLYPVLNPRQVVLLLSLNSPRPDPSLYFHAQNTDPNDQLHPAKSGRHPLSPTGARERGVREEEAEKERRGRISPIISTTACVVLFSKANPLTSQPSAECRSRRLRAAVVHRSSRCCC